MGADEQEALSRKYSNDVIILLPLKSGLMAVFNSARELCGFVEHSPTLWLGITAVWKPPPGFDSSRRPTLLNVSLEDIGL